MSIQFPDGLAARREYEATKGRSLHAIQDFAAGQVMAALFMPIMAPHSELIHLVCSYCGFRPYTVEDCFHVQVGLAPGTCGCQPQVPPPTKLKKCNGCKAVSYCDSKCQRSDWRYIHSRECKVLASMPHKLPSPARALLQILLATQKMGSHKPDPAWGWAEVLKGHADDIVREGGKRWERMLGLTRGMTKYALQGAGETRMATEDEMVRAVGFMAAIEANSFTDADSGRMNGGGVGGVRIQPTFSMANHSCVPNATVRVKGRVAILMALVPIKLGDEIEISYGDTTHPLAERKQFLRGYFFECSCRACRDDLNAYDLCKTYSPEVLNMNRNHILRNHTVLRDAPDLDAAARVLSKETRAAIMAANAKEGFNGDDKAPISPQIANLYARCRSLMDRGYWAIQPLPLIIEHYYRRMVSFGERESALAIQCLFALRCLPFQHPSPYHYERVDSLAALAQQINQSLEIYYLTSRPHPQDAMPGASPAAATLMGKIRARVAVLGSDTLSMTWAVGVVCLRYAAKGGKPDDENEQVREIRNVVEQLENSGPAPPGMEAWSVPSMAAKWHKDPCGVGSKWFLDTVVAPLEELADLAGQLLAELVGG